MNNYSQRLSKLEPAPDHQEYLREVGRRVMRYSVETRYQVKTGKLPEFAWGTEAEEIYQQWTKKSDFEAIEREILAGLGLSREKPFAR